MDNGLSSPFASTMKTSHAERSEMLEKNPTCGPRLSIWNKRYLSFAKQRLARLTKRRPLYPPGRSRHGLSGEASKPHHITTNQAAVLDHEESHSFIASIKSPPPVSCCNHCGHWATGIAHTQWSQLAKGREKCARPPRRASSSTLEPGGPNRRRSAKRSYLQLHTLSRQPDASPQ
jgi:hypothetical protein